jgi:hypothetical protein
MTPENKLLSIRNGTYFGECLVHCFEEITVTPDKVVYTLTSRMPDADRPDIRAESPMTLDAWQGLLGLLDWGDLASLPRTIGDPDAADAGGEFLEVWGDQGTKRVDFDKDAAVPKIAALLAVLRDLRARLALQHRP